MYVDKNKCEKKSTSIEYTFIILEYNERMFFSQKKLLWKTYRTIKIWNTPSLGFDMGDECWFKDVWETWHAKTNKKSSSKLSQVEGIGSFIDGISQDGMKSAEYCAADRYENFAR